MPDLTLSGLASGFDWKTLVDQLTELERAPQVRLRDEQNLLQQRNNAYASLATQVGVLRTRVTALKDPALYDSRLAKTGDATIATATTGVGAVQGTYTFNFTQMATASVHNGATNAGTKLNPTNNVSGLVLSAAAFAAPVTAGTFTVNGKQITVATTDTLQQVFTAINTATSGAVTGSYNNSTDRITLSSGSTITLGSATDTSNFLQAAKLNNSGTGTITSTFALGVIKANSTLATANFTTAISDGGSGAGEFKVNGVSISFNASTDTVNDLLARINSSSAGVAATYDSVNDRFLLSNKTTGDVGVALQDVTGNFLAASRLSTGTLTRGRNLLYTINGGGQLISQSNTLSESSSGLAGLSVTALKVGSTTVEVTSDTAKIKTAINDFIAENNKVQSLIETNVASTTDANGKVTAGTLAGETEPNEFATRLRTLVNAQVTGLPAMMQRLEQLDISSNGNDNNLVLTDSAKLDAALASNLSGVQGLFSNATNGLAVQLDTYLETAIGEDGALNTKQSTLTKQASAIDTQIADQERYVQSHRASLIASFIAMEKAQAQMNQQLQFLSQRFGTAS